jgi:hypothetical protein
LLERPAFGTELNWFDCGFPSLVWDKTLFVAGVVAREASLRDFKANGSEGSLAASFEGVFS